MIKQKMKKGELIKKRCTEFYVHLQGLVKDDKKDSLEKFYKDFFGSGSGEDVMNKIVRSGVRKNDLISLISAYLSLEEGEISPWIDLFYKILDA